MTSDLTTQDTPTVTAEEPVPPPEKRRRSSASTVVREDYPRCPILSYAEAALVAGVSVGTIQNWVSQSKRRKVPLKVCNRRGPFRIAQTDLNKFLQKR